MRAIGFCNSGSILDIRWNRPTQGSDTTDWSRIGKNADQAGIAPFIAGAWYRHNFENVDAVVPMIGVELGKMRIRQELPLSLNDRSQENEQYEYMSYTGH